MKICVNLATNLCSLFLASGIAANPQPILLKPAAVFDGQEMHAGWAVLVTGDKITATGPASGISAPAGHRSASQRDVPTAAL